MSETSTPRAISLRTLLQRKKGGPKFTELRATKHHSRSQILMEIEKDKDVRWPKPLRMEGERKNQHLYCRFHKDNGHNTDDCRQLKDEIEFLIRRGKLDKYTKDGNGGNNNRERQERDDRDK